MKKTCSYTSSDQLPLTLTVEEAASILRISRSTAYRLVTSGELPSFRAGHNLRIFKNHLFAFMGERGIHFA